VSDALLYVTDVSPYAAAPGREAMYLRMAGAHGVLGQSAIAIAELANAASLAFRHAASAAAIPPGALETARVLALFTIGETPWTDGQRTLIRERLRDGELALYCLHSAADSSHGWPEFGELLGARFDGHPWTQRFAIEVADADHPATRHLPGDWHFTDEVYLFRDLRKDARVLLRAAGNDLDMSSPGARRPECGFPLAWCFSEGRGRVFYTALGHFPSAYEDVRFLGHLYGGLEWVLGAGASATSKE
jgi:type 1 glutamine amidotransferase